MTDPSARRGRGYGAPHAPVGKVWGRGLGVVDSEEKAEIVALRL